MADLSVYGRQRTLADYMDLNRQRSLESRQVEANILKAQADADEVNATKLGQAAVMKELQGIGLTPQENAAKQLYLGLHAGGVTKDQLGNIYEKPGLASVLGFQGQGIVPQSPQQLSQDPSFESSEAIRQHQALYGTSPGQRPELAAPPAAPPILQLPEGSPYFNMPNGIPPMAQAEVYKGLAKNFGEDVSAAAKEREMIGKALEANQVIGNVSPQAASGFGQYAQDKALNLLNIPTERAAATGAMESATSYKNLQDRVAFLKGQGTVTDSESRIVESMAPKSTDSEPIRQAKLKIQNEILRRAEKRAGAKEYYLSKGMKLPDLFKIELEYKIGEAE